MGHGRDPSGDRPTLCDGRGGRRLGYGPWCTVSPCLHARAQRLGRAGRVSCPPRGGLPRIDAASRETPALPPRPVFLAGPRWSCPEPSSATACPSARGTDEYRPQAIYDHGGSRLRLDLRRAVVHPVSPQTPTYGHCCRRAVERQVSSACPGRAALLRRARSAAEADPEDRVEWRGYFLDAAIHFLVLPGVLALVAATGNTTSAALVIVGASAGWTVVPRGAASASISLFVFGLLA